jgi:predicted alpha/beta superfamily hydrolase
MRIIEPRSVRLLFLAAVVLGIAAQVPGSADTVPGGERLTLSSKILGEERTIMVSLPQTYARSVDRYPVLYLTDAQWQFDHTRTTAAFLARNGLMPEIIIVGVTSVDRTRDLYATRADFKNNGRVIAFPTSGNADHLLEFFERELIPWTEATYRTAPLRMLAGHSAGGNFALHSMRVKPPLFQVVIAASPWLDWDDGKELKQLLPFLVSDNVKTRALFLTCGGEGPEMKANLDAVTSALRTRKDASLSWDSAIYPNETHDSVVIKSYFDALRMIFGEWSLPRDPNTNLLKGSLDDVKAHYAKFGDRVGLSMLPPETAVNELGYQHLRAGDLDGSLMAFRYNTEIHPSSANVWDSLGDALDRAGRKDEALASYRKAVSLAAASGNPNLESFRKNVVRLESAAKRNPE